MIGFVVSGQHKDQKPIDKKKKVRLENSDETQLATTKWLCNAGAWHW
jgi:hypothetical protein